MISAGLNVEPPHRSDDPLDLLRAAPVFVPHPRVAAEARSLGIREVIVAGAADDEMLPALVAYFGAAG